MSEPDSKRSKMSEPDDIKSKRVPLIDPRALPFEELVQMESFIDHSNVIKRILEGPTRKFVVAPSRFCKSTNTYLAQSFLEIEVHRDGENYGEAVRDVMHEATSVEELEGANLKNYALFCVPEPKCKILEDEEFVLRHFGRYPVIKLDLEAPNIRSLSDALFHCLMVINDTYQNHGYLLKSNKLDKRSKGLNKVAQDVCSAWCSPIWYREGNDEIQKQNVKTGLANLAKYLHSHFGRKVVLLVDGFDAFVSMAKFHVETDEELTAISDLVIDMLGCDLKGVAADDHVEYVLLTGIETISGLGSSPRLAGVTKYMFLDREEFVGFYGAGENDVRDLVTKLKSKRFLPRFENKDVDQIMEYIMQHYDGYYSRGCQSISTLCLWSVLNYLEAGNVDDHWTKPFVMTDIEPFLKHPSIAAKILQLVEKPAGEETVLVKIPQTIEIPQLRELVKGDADQPPSVDLSLSYLMELGYLSNVKKGSGETSDDLQKTSEKVELKLANEEIRRELFKSLVQPDVEIVDFNFSIMWNNMSNVFCKILRFNMTEETCHKRLREFFENFKSFFTQGFAQFNEVDLNQSVFRSVMLIALCKIMPLELITSDDPIKDSKGKYHKLDRSGADIWMQDKTSNSVVIFQLKHNTLKYSSSTEEKKRTSLYALKEILGKEGGKKGCVSALNVLEPLDYLLIGLSMDSNFLPSISCLVNTVDDKKTICLSETELAKFPVYYEGCVDLLKE